MNASNALPDRPKRGRPRAFDINRAVDAARQQFLSRGYDRVTLADLTRAMRINPPSFYAAFGNKAMVFARIADAYAQEWTEEIRTDLAEDGPLAERLARVLIRSARRFAPPEGASHGGCMLLEAANNCSDAVVSAYVRKLRLGIAAAVYRGVSRTAPEPAVIATDQMMTRLAGLSAMAREGTDAARLDAIARGLRLYFDRPA